MTFELFYRKDIIPIFENTTSINHNDTITWRIFYESNRNRTSN